MSNLIKAANYISVDDHKLIEALVKSEVMPVESDELSTSQLDETALARQEELNELQSMKEQMLKDAKEEAESILRNAILEADQQKEAAQLEIDAWWQQRRTEDEALIEEARQAGTEQGYQDGLGIAEEEVKKNWNETIDQANSILEQAYNSKERIIQEAEPFLIDLSCGIAEKIIGHQLTITPEWIVEMVKEVLLRRREKGLITLCVSPSQFSFLQNVRDELALTVDSQAELQILPDRTVQDLGCVVRTEFGSIDARIDTQLIEIKNALHQLARGDFSESEFTSE